MFKSLLPVLLMTCTLVLSLWPTFTDDRTYTTFGWALAGMTVLYAVTILIERRNSSSQAVVSVVDQAAPVSAARIASPSLNSCRHAEGPQL